MRSRDRLFLKLFSSFLILTFVCEQLGFAAGDLKPIHLSAEGEKVHLSYSFPASVAKIEDSYKAPGSTKTVFLLQDAHTNESGQLNLSKALDTLLTNEKELHTVFAEAAVGNNSLSFLRTAKPLQEREELARSYIRKGLLHGAEYLDLTSEHAFTIWGVENPKLYIESLAQYRKSAKDRDRFELYLKKISASYEALSARLVSPSLKTLLDGSNAFESGNLSLTAYLEALTEKSAQYGVEINKYRSLSQLKDLQTREHKLDFKKANEEETLAVSSLSPEDRKTLSEVSMKADAPTFSGSLEDPRQGYFSLLEEKLSGHMADYPSLFEYFDYLKAAGNVDATRLLSELKGLEQELVDTIAVSQDEKTFAGISRMMRLYDKLFRLTLTPADHVEYESLKKELSIERLTGFLNKKIMDMGTYYDRSLFLEPGYEDILKSCEAFYALTTERDQNFMKEMTRKMDETGETKAALVTGGFHTTNLKALLKEKGISYVVVMPQVLRETNQARYESILLGQKMVQTPVQMAMAPGTMDATYAMGASQTAAAQLPVAPEKGPMLEVLGARTKSAAIPYERALPNGPTGESIGTEFGFHKPSSGARLALANNFSVKDGRNLIDLSSLAILGLGVVASFLVPAYAIGFIFFALVPAATLFALGHSRLMSTPKEFGLLLELGGFSSLMIGTVAAFTLGGLALWGIPFIIVGLLQVAFGSRYLSSSAEPVSMDALVLGSSTIAFGTFALLLAIVNGTGIGAVVMALAVLAGSGLHYMAMNRMEKNSARLAAEEARAAAAHAMSVSNALYPGQSETIDEQTLGARLALRDFATGEITTAPTSAPLTRKMTSIPLAPFASPQLLSMKGQGPGSYKPAPRNPAPRPNIFYDKYKGLTLLGKFALAGTLSLAGALAVAGIAALLGVAVPGIIWVFGTSLAGTALSHGLLLLLPKDANNWGQASVFIVSLILISIAPAVGAGALVFHLAITGIDLLAVEAFTASSLFFFVDEHLTGKSTAAYNKMLRKFSRDGARLAATQPHSASVLVGATVTEGNFSKALKENADGFQAEHGQWIPFSSVQKIELMGEGVISEHSRAVTSIHINPEERNAQSINRIWFQHLVKFLGFAGQHDLPKSSVLRITYALDLGSGIGAQPAARSTFLSTEQVQAIVKMGGDEIRVFLAKLAPHVDDPKNSPYADIATEQYQDIWDAARQWRAAEAKNKGSGDKLFSDEELSNTKSPKMPRIEFRGFAVSENRAAQVAVVGIPKQYRDEGLARMQEHPLAGSLSIVKGGTTKFEINVKGVGKDLAVRYYDKFFGQILDEAGYQPGPKIDARKNHEAWFTDVNLTLVGEDTGDISPFLKDSSTLEPFLEYLRNGGVVVLISGNDLERTLGRITEGNVIPPELYSRIVIIANGSANLAVVDPDGTPRELTHYREHGINETQDHGVITGGYFYSGDDVDPAGNDEAARRQLGSDRFISVSPATLVEQPESLKENYLGNTVDGTAAFLRALNEYTKNGEPVFTADNLRNIISRARQILAEQGKFTPVHANDNFKDEEPMRKTGARLAGTKSVWPGAAVEMKIAAVFNVAFGLMAVGMAPSLVAVIIPLTLFAAVFFWMKSNKLASQRDLGVMMEQSGLLSLSVVTLTVLALGGGTALIWALPFGIVVAGLLQVAFGAYYIANSGDTVSFGMHTMAAATLGLGASALLIAVLGGMGAGAIIVSLTILAAAGFQMWANRRLEKSASGSVSEKSGRSLSKPGLKRVLSANSGSLPASTLFASGARLAVSAADKVAVKEEHETRSSSTYLVIVAAVIAVPFLVLAAISAGFISVALIPAGVIIFLNSGLGYSAVALAAGTLGHFIATYIRNTVIGRDFILILGNTRVRLLNAEPGSVVRAVNAWLSALPSDSVAKTMAKPFVFTAEMAGFLTNKPKPSDVELMAETLNDLAQPSGARLASANIISTKAAQNWLKISALTTLGLGIAAGFVVPTFGLALIPVAFIAAAVLFAKGQSAGSPEDFGMLFEFGGLINLLIGFSLVVALGGLGLWGVPFVVVGLLQTAIGAHFLHSSPAAVSKELLVINFVTFSTGLIELSIILISGGTVGVWVIPATLAILAAGALQYWAGRNMEKNSARVAAEEARAAAEAARELSRLGLRHPVQPMMSDERTAGARLAVMTAAEAEAFLNQKVDLRRQYLIRPHHIQKVLEYQGNVRVELDEAAKNGEDPIHIYGMAFNPLEGLKDPQVFEVFRQIVERRYDTTALEQLYGIGKSPKKITFRGVKETPRQFATQMAEFLREHAGENPYDVADTFRQEFLKDGPPKELRPLFDEYMKVKPTVFDFEVIHDLIPSEGNIADIGAGHNVLGQQVLEYADDRGLSVRHVVGTDINDWQDATHEGDGRLAFVYQDSATSFPLSANSYDMVIVKWVLHHMTEEKKQLFLKDIERILKPGGRLIVFEALGAEASENDIWDAYTAGQEDAAAWGPAGEWRQSNLDLNEAFKKLSLAQQKAVDALEDYFGHNVVMNRFWMPQPFTYQAVSEIRRTMDVLGFSEKTGLRRVYGAAPMIRMGPPSVRLVFEKKKTPITLVRGDGGHNKAMVNIGGASAEDEKHIKRILDVLVAQDRVRRDLEGEQIDDIVLMGNERLDTFEEALQLLNSGIGSRVVILGSFGLATLPLIDNAVAHGYEIEIAPGVKVDKISWPARRASLQKNGRVDLIQTTEARIIRQIMEQMIAGWPNDYAHVAALIRTRGLDRVLVTEGQAHPTPTRKLLMNYHMMLDREGAFNKIGGQRIVLIQKPNLQLRAKASFEDVFNFELRERHVHLVSHTVSYDNVSIDKAQAIQEIIREVWRIIIHSHYGTGFVNLRSSERPKGIDSLPQDFWNSTSYLFDQVEPSARRALAGELLGLLIDEQHSIKDILPNDNRGLREFILKVNDTASGARLSRVLLLLGGVLLMAAIAFFAAVEPATAATVHGVADSVVSFSPDVHHVNSFWAAAKAFAGEGATHQQIADIMNQMIAQNPVADPNHITPEMMLHYTAVTHDAAVHAAQALNPGFVDPAVVVPPQVAAITPAASVVPAAGTVPAHFGAVSFAITWVQVTWGAIAAAIMSALSAAFYFVFRIEKGREKAKTVSKEEVSPKPALSPEQEAMLDEAATRFNLNRSSKLYLKQMWIKFLHPDVKPLRIMTERSNPGQDENFIMASMLTDNERETLLGAYTYLKLKNDKANERAARKVVLTVNSLDGGIGESLNRIEFLRKLFNTPDVQMGAKGTDLGFEVSIKGKPVFISIAELKLLHLIMVARSGGYGAIKFQPLVNWQSRASYEKLLDSTVYLEDRLQAGPVQRTYRQVMQEAGIQILDMLEQDDLPGIEKATGNLSLEADRTVASRQPGGHGQWGYLFLTESYLEAPPADGKTHIRFFNNGDNPNERPDPSIAGYAARKHLPIVKLTTSATEIDKKGGKDGLRVVRGKDGKETMVPDQMELADAKDADKASPGQLDAFYSAGLEGGLGEAGKQPFNTNMFYINDTVLHEIAQELAAIVGEDEYFRIIAPALIAKDAKKGKDDIERVPVDGAIGVAIHNLNTYFLTSTDPRVKAILTKRGLDRLLYFVDVPRDFFTPVKKTSDMAFLQSDYYEFDTESWLLKETEKGLEPPEIDLDESIAYWKELQNLIDAFGKVGMKRLISLKIKGEGRLPNAVLAGKVEITFEKAVDLNDYAEIPRTSEGRLLLENIRIHVDAEGKLTVENIEAIPSKASGPPAITPKPAKTAFIPKPGAVDWPLAGFSLATLVMVIAVFFRPEVMVVLSVLAIVPPIGWLGIGIIGLIFYVTVVHDRLFGPKHPVSGDGQPRIQPSNLPTLGGTVQLSENDLKFKVSFGTSGWRDSTDKGFTHANVGRFAQAVADYLKSVNFAQRVAVGFDARPGAREYAKHIVEVLVANGIPADLIDQVNPTPVMSEATRKGADYGVAIPITASHNSLFTAVRSGHYQMGIKMMKDGVPAGDDVTGAISTLANDPARNASYIWTPYEEMTAEQTNRGVDLIAKSNERLRKVFDFGRLSQAEFKLVIDSMYGGSVEAAKVFQELGIVKEHLRAIPMQQALDEKLIPESVIDPDSGTEIPWRPEPLEFLLKDDLLAKTAEGDLGGGIDGDGDRAWVKDISGRIMSPNELGLIFAHYLYSKGERGVIVRTLPSTQTLDLFAEKYKLRVEETPVGSKWFAPFTTSDDPNEQLLVAVEESGHIFFKYKGEIFADSAIAEIFLAAEIIQETGMSLSDYLKNIYKEIGELYYVRTAVNISLVTDELKKNLADRRANDAEFPMAFANKVAEKLGKTLLAENTIDLRDKSGVKVKFTDHSWVMYRISGTDGSIRIYAEDTTPDGLNRMTQTVQDVIVEMTGSQTAAHPAPAVLQPLDLDDEVQPEKINLTPATERAQAAILLEKMTTPLKAADPKTAEDFRRGGYGQPGYGVSEGAAINGSVALTGNQGYYAEGGREYFTKGIEAWRAFFARIESLRLLMKHGIGGQHTPFQGIADFFAAIGDPNVLLTGEYELGEDYEAAIQKKLDGLSAGWNEVVNVPSSKSGSTDETMVVFSQILFAMLKNIAPSEGLDGKAFANLVFETLHEVNFIDGKERPGKDLFKVDGGDLVGLLVQRGREKRLDLDEAKVTAILQRVLGNMFFETTDNPSESRLSAFIRNSGLDKVLGDKGPGFGGMFENVGGRWTADLHIMPFLALNNVDPATYWEARDRAVRQTLEGKHTGNQIGGIILDDNIRHMALLVPDELFWFGKAIEQNFNESIWQKYGIAKIVAVRESDWEAQKTNYADRHDRMVIRIGKSIAAGTEIKEGFAFYNIPLAADYDKDATSAALALADLFSTFYAMTITVGNRMIIRALADKGFTAADVDVNDLTKPATKVFQRNLYLLQFYVELGKKIVEKLFAGLQAEETAHPGAIERDLQVRKDSALAREIRSNIDGLGSGNASDVDSIAAAITKAADFAKAHDRTFVPILYLEGKKFQALRDRLIKLGYEWVLQGTGDQHISLNQVLENPEKYVLFIVSFLPKETLPGLPAIGFAKGYLDRVSPHHLRDAFAESIYEAMTGQLVQEGQDARAVFLRMEDSPASLADFDDASSKAAGKAMNRVSKSVPPQVITVIPQDFGREAARNIAQEIIRLQKDPEKIVNVVFATGNTMVPIYSWLVRATGIDWSRVRAFQLDEYQGMDQRDEGSFSRFLIDHLYSKLLPKGLKKENIFLMYGKSEETLGYADRMRQHGVPDVVIAGIGPKTGHLAFNEPPSTRESRMRLVSLSPETIKANKLKNGQSAYTIGLADILEARKIFLFANGKGKAEIVQKALKGEITPNLPASFLQEHSNVTVLLDGNAASKLNAGARLAANPEIQEAVTELRAMAQKGVFKRATDKSTMVRVVKDLQGYLDNPVSRVNLQHINALILGVSANVLIAGDKAVSDQLNAIASKVISSAGARLASGNFVESLQGLYSSDSLKFLLQAQAMSATEREAFVRRALTQETEAEGAFILTEATHIDMTGAFGEGEDGVTAVLAGLKETTQDEILAVARTKVTILILQTYPLVETLKASQDLDAAEKGKIFSQVVGLYNSPETDLSQWQSRVTSININVSTQDTIFELFQNLQSLAVLKSLLPANTAIKNLESTLLSRYPDEFAGISGARMSVAANGDVAPAMEVIDQYLNRSFDIDQTPRQSAEALLTDLSAFPLETRAIALQTKIAQNETEFFAGLSASNTNTNGAGPYLQVLQDETAAAKIRTARGIANIALFLLQEDEEPILKAGARMAANVGSQEPVTTGLDALTPEISKFFIQVALANPELSQPQGARLALFDNLTGKLELFGLHVKGQALEVAFGAAKVASLVLTKEASLKLLSGISSSQDLVEVKIKISSMRIALGEVTAEIGTDLKMLHVLDASLIGQLGKDPTLDSFFAQALDQLKHGDKNFRLTVSNQDQLGAVRQYASEKDAVLASLFDLTGFNADRTAHYHDSNSTEATFPDGGLNTHFYVQKKDDGFINFAFPLSSVMARGGKGKWTDPRIVSVFSAGVDPSVAVDNQTLTRVVDGTEQRAEVRGSYAFLPLLDKMLWNEIFHMTQNWIRSVGRSA